MGVSTYTELELSDGTAVRFEIAAAGGGPVPTVDEGLDLPEGMGVSVPVGLGGRGVTTFAVETLRTALHPLGPLLQEVHDAITGSERPPQEVNVTFGVEVGGDLKLGIVGADGRAHLTVSATWRPAPHAG